MIQDHEDSIISYLKEAAKQKPPSAFARNGYVDESEIYYMEQAKALYHRILEAARVDGWGGCRLCKS